MSKFNFHHKKIIYLVAVISLLFATSGLRAQEQSPASEALSEGTKDFLSDPARTGSLLGSILAGAAVANPLAPLLGSVAGFMIGKSSAFSEENSNTTRRQDYINRSLIPDDGNQVGSLSGLTGNQPLAPVQTAILSLPAQVEMDDQLQRLDKPVIVGAAENSETKSRSEQIVFVELPEEPDSVNPSIHTEQTVSLGLNGVREAESNLQKQLAYECSNAQVTKALSLRCYYYSQ